MLSRLDDARVFLSSNDVVLGSSAAQRGPGAGLEPQSVANQRGLGIDIDSGSDDALDDEEHAQLHPQHPYNMRKSRAAATRTLALHGSRTGRRRLADSVASQPMEFVMLSSGDIRPRNECPLGLALPPPPASHVGRRLEIGEISDDSPRGHGRLHEEEEEEDGSEKNTQERPQAKRAESRRHAGEREEWRERAYRPVTERRPRAQQSTADRRRSETPQRRTSSSKRGGKAGYASSDDDDDSGFASVSSLSSSGHAGASTRNGGAPTATRKRHPQPTAQVLQVDSDEDEGDEALHSHHRSTSDPRKERARQMLMISRQHTPKASSRPRLESERSGQASRGSTALPKKMEVAPVYHIADEDEDEEDEEERVEQVKKPAGRKHRQQTPRADRKLDVNQLVSSKEEEKTPKQASQSKLVRQLEQELQNEKKRVLEKMTLLLEEQGKNQQLHRQIETLESRLESSTRDATSNASETHKWEERVHALERKHAEAIKSMEEQLQQRDAVVLRLEQDKERLKDAVSKLRDRAGREKAGKNSQTETENDLKSQLEQLAESIRKFLKRVDRWKANSKEAMECCERKADLAALMENMWLDFPQFPDWTDTTKSDNNAAEATNGGHGENIVRFLKKRVRSREDELRQLQAKYVELKELCARQCVREADLQNFINEHRLRGNLIIRKSGNGGAEDSKKRAAPRQQRESKAPPSSRATKPGAYYADDDEEEDEYEEDDRHNNNDYESGGEEEEDDGEYPVREPKIFVQIGRDGIYEHTPGGTSAVLEKLADQQRRQGRKKASQVEVERIRLVPSPSLSQRYEHVATPTSNGTALNRKKKTQTLLQPPPRSGAAHSRPSANHPGASSSSSLARRRPPTMSVRSKPAASSRPSAAASARTTSGVGRPWV